MKLKLSPDVAALNPLLKESEIVTARVTDPAIKGITEDQADVFLTYWHMRGHLHAPQPLQEYHFAAHLGRDYRFDFAWPAPNRRTLSLSKGSGLALEVDGGQYLARGGRHNTDTDRAKLNLAAELGWIVLRYSPHMIIQDPDAVILQVERTLRRLKLMSPEAKRSGEWKEAE